MEYFDEIRNLTLSNEIKESDMLAFDESKYYDKEMATNQLVDTFVKKSEKKIEEEIERKETTLKNTESDFAKNVVKSVVEAALKLVLKKKFNVSFATFNEAKKALESMLGGDTKSAVKSASDVALKEIKGIDADTKTAIKSIKNTVIDNTFQNSEYEIAVKQTRIVNRMKQNCEDFEKYMLENDVKNIQKKAKSIQKDMKEILPIRDTIISAQRALDKYELWKHNGNRILTEEENELIEKFYQSA